MFVIRNLKSKRLGLLLGFVCGWGAAALSQAPDNFNPGPSSWTAALAVQPDGKVIIGGGFAAIGPSARGRVARLTSSGGLDASFANANANGDVYALACLPDGRLVVGGEFTALGNQSRYAIGRLNTNGLLDTTFNASVFDPPPAPPIPSHRVQAILVQPDGRLVVGGRTTTQLQNGQTSTVGFVRRLNTNGALDGTFTIVGEIDGPVNTLAVQAGGNILVGGQFATFAGQPRARIARIGPTGVLDASFSVSVTPSVGAGVTTLVVQPDDKILVGGFFTAVAGAARTNLARIDTNGTVDAGFNPGAGTSSSLVYTMALQADGRILVGGIFSTLSGVARSRIGRLAADGSVDPSFDPGANADVYGVTVAPDGKILVGGLFTFLGGQPRNFIGRFAAAGAVSQSLSYSNTTLIWRRSGSIPEFGRTTFELTTNGTVWSDLGAGTRSAGGWDRLTTALPPSGVVRARGYVASGGFNATSWFVESVLPIVPQLLTDDGAFGFDANQRFGFTVRAPTNSSVVLDASTNLADWVAVATNSVGGAGQFLFRDLDPAPRQQRFYRAHFP